MNNLNARRGTQQAGNQSISVSRGFGNQSISMRQGYGTSTTLKLLRPGNSVGGLAGVRPKLSGASIGQNLSSQPPTGSLQVPQLDSDASTQLHQIAEEDEDGMREARFGGDPQNTPGHGEQKQSLVAMIKEQSAQASKGSGDPNSVGTQSPLITGSIRQQVDGENNM